MLIRDNKTSIKDLSWRDGRRKGWMMERKREKKKARGEAWR